MKIGIIKLYSSFTLFQKLIPYLAEIWLNIELLVICKAYTVLISFYVLPVMHCKIMRYGIDLMILINKTEKIK